MQLLPRPEYEKKNAFTAGGIEKGTEKGISFALTWIGELLEECFVARGGTAGDGGSPHFSTLYTSSSSVHVCHHYYHHRQNPLLLLLLSSEHQHHNSRRGNNYLLSHSVSRQRSLSRRDAGCFAPPLAGRPRNVHSRNFVIRRHRRSM